LDLRGGVAMDDRSEHQHRDLLYISLEMTAADVGEVVAEELSVAVPETVTVAERWPALAAGGEQAIRRWLVEHPVAGMIAIDPVTPLLSLNPTTAQAEVHRLRLLAEEHGVELVLTTSDAAPAPGIDLLKEAHHVTIVGPDQLGDEELQSSDARHVCVEGS
jgi:hypothetical protein